MLDSFTVVDLSAPLSPDTVMWPGEEPLVAVDVETHERDGSFSRRVTLGEHTGTHFDAPVHFAPDGTSVDEIPGDRLVVPLRVIDIGGRIGDDPDGELEPADVDAHERRHGTIASGCAVFLRTGWDSRRLDRAAYAGSEGRAHDLPVHRYVSLPSGVWHLENLVHLDAVPAHGAWVVVGVPRVVGASGFPARVLALVPAAAADGRP